MKSRLFLLSLFVFPAFAVLAQNGGFEEQGRKFMMEFPVRLEKGEATAQDLADCQNLWRTAPSEEAKRIFLLFAAQYQRKIAKNPALCVEMLLPTLGIEPTSAKTGEGKSPKKEPLSVPPLEEWKIDATNAFCAVEIANCLVDEGQYEMALEIVDSVGRGFSDESRVLAAETGGDLYVKMRMFDRAAEFYSFGLKALETLKKTEYDPGKGNRVFFSEEQKIIKNRIETKRQAVQKQLDAERYGPDWVAYRDAREKHFAEDFLSAYWLYEKLINDYPDTVYAEAARCYRIVLLTKFSDIPNLEKVPDLLKSKQKQLSDLRMKLNAARKQKNSDNVQKYQAEMSDLTAFIALASALPTGLSALQKAEKEAELFIASDATGLYRGEVMLEIGLAWLNTFVEPEKAEKWLERSWDWFEKVRHLDTRLDQFQVPDKAAQVSQPPQTERVQDTVWHNITYAKLKPGELFNRRECSWYATSKEKVAVSWLGLIAYAREDYPRAKKIWETLYTLDSHFKQEDNSNGFTWSYVKRFLWNIDHNQGGMYAWPSQMAAFKGTKIRWQLLLADVELEMQNYPPAEKKFRKLLKNPEILRSRERYAYCSYGLGVALMYLRKKEEMERIFMQFLPGQKFDRTTSAERALWLLACQWSQSSKTELKALNVFQIIFERYPDSPHAQGAYLSWAIDSGSAISPQAAVERLRSYMKKYPKADKEDVLEMIDMFEHPEKYEDEYEDEYE
ncbi:MAG: hypothetical protein Q4D38_05300 [Planctomycetia bacterium]|nr:hypothetical protein [Planctomycetia bacterium]